MFIIVYIIITAAACGMVYLGYLQGTERFYMTLFSAAVVLYCIYLDFKKRREKKAEDQKTEPKEKLTRASKVKGDKNPSIRDAAHKSTKRKDVTR